MLDKLKEQLENIFSSNEEKNVIYIEKNHKQKKDLIDKQLKKNNNFNKTNKFNPLFPKELKREYSEDSLYYLRKQNNPNKIEQNKLDSIIKKDNELKIFKKIIFRLSENLILIKEAIEWENKVKKSYKINITPKHLKQVGLLKQEEDLPDNFDFEEGESDSENQLENLNRFINPMAQNMNNKRKKSLNNINDKDNTHTSTNNNNSNKYHSKINERRIYNEEQESIYRNEITNFLKNNENYFVNHTGEKMKNEKNEDLLKLNITKEKSFEDEDFFDDLLEEDD